MDREEKTKQEVAEGKYPGVAIDVADDDKVSREAVDAETRSLNNNPRNDK